MPAKPSRPKRPAPRKRTPSRARTQRGQRAIMCGAGCTCDGVGCGKKHPPSNLHCQKNPICPIGCSGTCFLGQGHEPYSSHACDHGHTFD